MNTCSGLSAAMDKAIETSTDPDLVQMRRRKAFDLEWTIMGLPHDPQLMARTFRALQPRLDQADRTRPARNALAAQLAAEKFGQRIRAAAAEGKQQGRAQALAEHDAAVAQRAARARARADTQTLARLDQAAGRAVKRQAAYRPGRGIFGGYLPRGHQRIVY